MLRMLPEKYANNCMLNEDCEFLSGLRRSDWKCGNNDSDFMDMWSAGKPIQSRALLWKSTFWEGAHAGNQESAEWRGSWRTCVQWASDRRMPSTDRDRADFAFWRILPCGTNARKKFHEKYDCKCLQPYLAFDCMCFGTHVVPLH